MERGQGKPSVYTVAALQSPALTDRRSRRCLETGSLDPPLAALRRFPRSICRRQIKVLKSFSAGCAPVTASGAPAKAQLLWGKEKETELRSVSPQAEPNKAQFLSTRWWGRSRGNRRNAASGGKSKAVSRQRRDWRPEQGRESQCRNGVSPLPLESVSKASRPPGWRRPP